MIHREADVVSAEEAVRLRKEIEQWRGAAQTYSWREIHWWNQSRKIQKIRSTFGAQLANCELIPARVVLGDALPYGQSQTVYSGTIRGVEPGMRVIDVLTDRSKALPGGDQMRAITGYSAESGKPLAGSILIGWVEAAGSFTARVRLVTDKKFKVQALLHRRINPQAPRRVTVKTPDGPTVEVLTRKNNHLIPVTLSGDGERGMVTESIPREHNIRPGDWLWSMGRSAKLPIRLRIGKVTEVIELTKNPNFVTAKVIPASDLGSLQDIFIVRSLASPPPPRGGD
ncbi:MAG: hypothetical protein HN350_12750, partial [Phycisphaerales bacterium]|nr:hypothetical protein [Phycisphaerales bacterium]